MIRILFLVRGKIDSKRGDGSHERHEGNNHSERTLAEERAYRCDRVVHKVRVVLIFESRLIQLAIGEGELIRGGAEVEGLVLSFVILEGATDEGASLTIATVSVEDSGVIIGKGRVYNLKLAAVDCKQFYRIVIAEGDIAIVQRNVTVIDVNSDAHCLKNCTCLIVANGNIIEDNGAILSVNSAAVADNQKGTSADIIRNTAAIHNRSSIVDGNSAAVVHKYTVAVNVYVIEVNVSTFLDVNTARAVIAESAGDGTVIDLDGGIFVNVNNFTAKSTLIEISVNGVTVHIQNNGNVLGDADRVFQEAGVTGTMDKITTL